MRAFLLADTHLGMRYDSVEWLDMACGWIEDEFLPAARAEYRPGDVLVHLGDVFDNRRAISLLAQHRGISIFEKLGELFVDGVYVIAGNHDVMKRTGNDVCSLDCLKWVPNVRVYKEPDVVEIGGQRALLMPWRQSPEDERACIAEHAIKRPRYLFCHTNVQQLSLGGGKLVEEGLSADDLEGFHLAFAGHIHLRQTLRKLVMVGNPYQMTRGDAGDEKGWHLLDLDAGTYEFRPNLTSPRFKSVRLGRWADRPLDELLDECRGHRVDLFVPNEYIAAGYSVAPLVEEVGKVAAQLDVVTYDDTPAATGPLGASHDPSGVGVAEMCTGYVGGMNGLDAATRERLTSKIASLYAEVTGNV